MNYERIVKLPADVSAHWGRCDTHEAPACTGIQRVHPETACACSVSVPITDTIILKFNTVF